MTISCNRGECDREWPRDPVLEVECPTCGASVGRKCKRPSGHGGNFVHPHQSRDRAAVGAGHYGECPLDICAETLDDIDGPDLASNTGKETSEQATFETL
jgi:hypothetical protein